MVSMPERPEHAACRQRTHAEDIGVREAIARRFAYENVYVYGGYPYAVNPYAVDYDGYSNVAPEPEPEPEPEPDRYACHICGRPGGH